MSLGYLRFKPTAGRHGELNKTKPFLGGGRDVVVGKETEAGCG
jgi:hypothetical protein